MISKINKIKNLGLVFKDYTWNNELKTGKELPIFKRYNLIYGWNGTGKTTFSKLFDALEAGTLKDNQSLEYEIENEVEKKYKNGEPFNRKIRVFNQDYIENNLKIRDGKAKSITLILGDANKEIVEVIEKDKERLKGKNNDLKKATDDLDQKNKSRGKIFTEIAKTIYVAITGGAVRNYRKDNAENDFATLPQIEILSDDDLSKFSLVVKQNSKPLIDKPEKIEFEKINGDVEDLASNISNLLAETKQILFQKVQSETIERLKNNQDISSWVESGIAIHNNHKSDHCEFCNQLLPEGRIDELLKHFNEADKKLKQDIDILLANFSEVYNFIDKTICPDIAKFYDELHTNYDSKCVEFNMEKSSLLENIKKIEKLVENKKFKTTESVNFIGELNVNKFILSVQAVESQIDSHNKKTSDFEGEKVIAINKLKRHYLSTIFDEVKNLDKEIQNCKDSIDTANNGSSLENDLGISALQKRISENLSKISSTHKACGDINTGLSTFLGRNELIFEPNKIKINNEMGEEQEVDDGYAIKRAGKLADHLSEGEKTAIAFVYFTIHLKDQSFDLKDGIVLIDDPVSSLDSSSLFQAFAFLKNAVKDAKQIFILTHNFEFLKLLLNWVKNIDHGREAGFYMIKNCYKSDCRCAFLDKMDRELCEYESEYHYLFKILKEFQSDGTIAQAYPIPNIARKVLDTFLMFRVPCGGGTYVKLEKMKHTTDFDENKITAIYKFTNDQSHITGSGFDPALVPETQKNVKYLLEMIEKVFPEHYKILEESITQ